MMVQESGSLYSASSSDISLPGRMSKSKLLFLLIFNCLGILLLFYVVS